MIIKFNKVSIRCGAASVVLLCVGLGLSTLVRDGQTLTEVLGGVLAFAFVIGGVGCGVAAMLNILVPSLRDAERQ